MTSHPRGLEQRAVPLSELQTSKHILTLMYCFLLTDNITENPWEQLLIWWMAPTAAR